MAPYTITVRFTDNPLWMRYVSFYRADPEKRQFSVPGYIGYISDIRVYKIVKKEGKK